MDGPVPAPLPLPSGANGRPGFTSPMSKEKSAEHTPLMKHHGRMLCIRMFLKDIFRDRAH